MYDLAPHQRLALARMSELDSKAGLFIGVGGGKTRVALAHTQQRQCKRILVVLPLSVTSVWEREVRIVDYPLPVQDLTVEGTIKDRARAMRRIGSAIVLINWESYWREPLRSQITHWAPDALIADEGHRLRHRGSRQSRYAHILAPRPPVQVRLALTGTPINNGLQDAWSIMKFVNPTVWPRYPDFEARYLIMGGFHAHQIVGYQNKEECERLIAEHSFQWEGQTFATPRDIPITVRLSPSTRRVYEELRKRAVVEIKNADGESREVVARIVLTLILRLQQIACGFAKDVGEEEIDLSQEKADTAMELIEDAIAQGQRVVVFARFLHDLNLMEKRLTDKRISYGRIDGSKTGAKRKEELSNWDAGLYGVMLAQIKAAGLGIDLAAASVAIFYSVGFSLDELLQAKGRLIGALRQQHNVVFYHLLSEKTVDERIYRDLTNKVQIAREVTSLRYALDLFGP